MLDEIPGNQTEPSKRLRSIGFQDARQDSLFDEAGFPIGKEWDEIDFPNIADKHAFALEVQGDGMLPAYRDGDVLIVSPSTGVRRYDRIILKAATSEVIAGTLLRRTAQRLELEHFNLQKEKLTFLLKDVTWLSRIIWARAGS